MTSDRIVRLPPVFYCSFLLCVSLAFGPAGSTWAEDSQQSAANEEAAASRFLRLVRNNAKEPTAMEASIVRHKSRGDDPSGPTVDLVAAVHVADKSYYVALNREFRKYDVVLFELVAPKGTEVPRGGGKSDNPVSLLQNMMKNVLELEYQLSVIDYTRENMVHADMSPEQFANSMRDRNESVLGMFLRMFGYAIARQSQETERSPDAEMLLALFDKNRALALKRVVAEQFQDMDGTLSALEGPDGSTIISERNKVALAVLRKQIAAGKRKIAIFYGAGHMPDLQKRLEKDFNLLPTDTRWLKAWDLQGKSEK